MVHLARLDMDEQTVRDLDMGGLVHDIGKARLKLDVLNKSEPLDDNEMRHVRTHPSLGFVGASRRHSTRGAGYLPFIIMRE
jgi:HD-GYP domain-containing protein (c-di-GMP phosphodiesterase class II)